MPAAKQIEFWKLILIIFTELQKGQVTRLKQPLSKSTVTDECSALRSIRKNAKYGETKAENITEEHRRRGGKPLPIQQIYCLTANSKMISEIQVMNINSQY